MDSAATSLYKGLASRDSSESLCNETRLAVEEKEWKNVVYRTMFERIVTDALCTSLPSGHRQFEIAQMMASYVSNDNVNEWAPISIGPCKNNNDGDNNHLKGVCIRWEALHLLEGTTAFTHLKWDPYTNYIYYYYRQGSDISSTSMQLLTDFFNQFSTTTANNNNNNSNNVGYHTIVTTLVFPFPLKTLPTHYTDKHIHECRHLKMWERVWATRLWESGPQTMLELLACIYQSPEKSYASQRCVDIIELAFTIQRENTRFGVCRSLDSVLTKTPCCRMVHIVMWVCISCTFLLSTIFGIYYYFFSSSSSSSPSTRVATPVVNSLFGIACLSFLVLFTWCSIPSTAARVQLSGVFLCVGGAALTMLVIVLVVDTATTVSWLFRFAQLSATLLVVCSCCICWVLNYYSEQPIHQGGMLTHYTRYSGTTLPI